MTNRVSEHRGYTITVIATLDGFTVTWSNGQIAGVKPGNVSRQAAIEWAKARIDEKEKRDYGKRNYETQ